MMKRPKRNRIHQKPKEAPQTSSTTSPIDDFSDSEDEGGFSKWLRSNEGIELLKFFVLGNSLVVFLMMTWPNMREAFNSAYYIIHGEKSE